jgi:predicted transcriptional regulator
VIPTPSTSPLSEEDETSQIPALFQNYSLRMLEELERAKVDRERLLTRESDLLFEIRRLTNRVKELENLAEIGLVDQILSLAHKRLWWLLKFRS